MHQSSEQIAQNRNLVIACLEYHPKAMILMRLARNRALQIGGKWRIVLVETPELSQASNIAAQEQMLRLLTMAKQMGGETVYITADSPKDAVLKLLEEEKDKTAFLIVGNSWNNRIFHLRRTLMENLVRLAHRYRIPVEVVRMNETQYNYSLRARLRLFNVMHMLYALLSVGVASLVTYGLYRLLPPALFRINNQNIGLLFMTACAFSAGRFGLIPGLLASVTSFIMVNYFFIAPHYQINLSSVTDFLNMGIFLSAAFLISFFTGQTRGYAEKATKRELSTRVLFNLYRVASEVSSRQQALEKLQDHLARAFKMQVAFFMPSLMRPESLETVFPSDITLDENDIKALELCWKDIKTTGIASPSFRDCAWRFEPMMAQSGAIGIIGVKPKNRDELDVWFGSMLLAVADQVATILEHIELDHVMEATRMSEEREKLRSMLLSSISHDLKTPLASIIGALNIHRSHAKKLAPEKCESLIETALSEAVRLESFITNILDMTRLESKKIEFRQDWHEPQSILQDVMKRLEYRTRSHKVIVHTGADELEVYMDHLITAQVLQNVIDNACKYTPDGTLIEIRTFADKDKGFSFEIRDHGNGIPPQNMVHIFDKYARLTRRDSQIAGTGLGLAISKAVMEAQGGAITVDNHPEGGAIFTLFLPHWRALDGTRKYA